MSEKTPNAKLAPTVLAFVVIGLVGAGLGYVLGGGLSKDATPTGRTTTSTEPLKRQDTAPMANPSNEPNPAANAERVAGSDHGDVPDRSKIVAEVGDSKIMVGELEAKVEEVPIYARKNFLKPDGKKQLLDNMIKGEVLYLAAKQAGYDQHPEVQAKVLETVKSIYQSEYFKREIQNAVVKHEQEAREFYEQNKERYRIPEHRTVRHIQVTSQSKADELKQQLTSGAEWNAVAKQHSEDGNTKDTGGLLGAVAEDKPIVTGIGTEPEIVQALFNAEPDKVIGPLQSQKGWHLFQIDEVKPASFQPFDVVKADLSDMFLVTEEDVVNHYEANKENYQVQERVNISHILVQDRLKAQEAMQKAKSGGEWEQLVRLHSTDSVTATKGGNIGYVYRDGVIRGIGKDEELTRKLFTMKPGEVSEPYQSPKGFHVFKVNSYEPERQKTLPEMHSTIRNQLLRDARENILEAEFQKLKNSFNVKIYEDRIVDTSWQLQDQDVQVVDSPDKLPFAFPGQGE